MFIKVVDDSCFKNHYINAKYIKEFYCVYSFKNYYHVEVILVNEINPIVINKFLSKDEACQYIDSIISDLQ